MSLSATYLLNHNTYDRDYKEDLQLKKKTAVLLFESLCNHIFVKERTHDQVVSSEWNSLDKFLWKCDSFSDSRSILTLTNGVLQHLCPSLPGV